MTLVCDHKLQALLHIAAHVRDMIKVCLRPLDPNPMLKILHRARVVGVHAPLQVAPQVLDRVEIRTLGRSVDAIDAIPVEPEGSRASGVRRRVILLVPPVLVRPEDAS